MCFQRHGPGELERQLLLVHQRSERHQPARRGYPGLNMLSQLKKINHFDTYMWDNIPILFILLNTFMICIVKFTFIYVSH